MCLLIRESGCQEREILQQILKIAFRLWENFLDFFFKWLLDITSEMILNFLMMCTFQVSIL